MKTKLLGIIPFCMMCMVLVGCDNGLALGWHDESSVRQDVQPPAHLPASVTPLPTPSSGATMVPITDALITMHASVPESLAPDILAQLPKDESGRTIGGTYIPLMNYSPTMITGKPCPRVKQWTFKVVKMSAPLHDFGISDNPCVVQNAVDDLVRTLIFYIGNNTPESMREIESIYDTDSMNILGVESTFRDSLIRYYREGKQVYSRCNKPLYHLLAVDARTPLIANNSGEVSGLAIQISILKATKDVAAYQCDAISYKDGHVVKQFGVTAGMLRGDADGVAETYYLLWIPQSAHWRIYYMDILPFPGYAETANRLWDSVKPNYPSLFARK